MRRSKPIFAVCCCVPLVLAMYSIGLADNPIAVGDMVPDFKLPGSDGKTYKLSDFHGKKAVVIAWFPKAFTGG